MALKNHVITITSGRFQPVAVNTGGNLQKASNLRSLIQKHKRAHYWQKSGKITILLFMKFGVLFCVLSMLNIAHVKAQYDHYAICEFKHPQTNQEIEFNKIHRIKSVELIYKEGIDTSHLVRNEFFKEVRNYDVNGRLISMRTQGRKSGKEQVYSYKKDGRIRKYSEKILAPDSQCWEYRNSLVFLYYRNGLLKSIKKEIPYQRIIANFKYGRKENKLTHTDHDKPISNFFFNDKNELVKSDVRTPWTGGIWICQYKYDKKGNLLSKEVLSYDSAAFTRGTYYVNLIVNNTFNLMGNLEKHEEYSFSVQYVYWNNVLKWDTVISKYYYEYVYDNDNREVEYRYFSYDNTQKIFVLKDENITNIVFENGLEYSTITSPHLNNSFYTEISKNGVILQRDNYSSELKKHTRVEYKYMLY